MHPLTFSKLTECFLSCDQGRLTLPNDEKELALSRPRPWGRVLAALFTAGALAFTGCAADNADADTEDVDVAGTVEEDRAPDNERPPLPEVNLPDDFPANVPLFDGPLTSAQSLKMGDDKGYWDLMIRTDDAPAAMLTVRHDMVAAGFEETNWNEIGEMVSGLWESDELRIAVQSAKDINGHALLYNVMEK